jgi:hypothetical protein
LESPGKSKSEAIDIIMKLWSEISAEYTKKLIDSIYSRPSEVIRLKGGAINY